MMSSDSLNRFNPSESPNYGFVAPSSPSPNLRAFLAYVKAAEAWDVDRTMEFFDDALEHRILPQSLGRPVLNKRQYGEYLRALRPFFKTYQVTIHEVIEADNKMTAHASSNGVSVSGVPYANEHVLVIHYAPVSESAGPDALPKMRLVKEYVDSSFSLTFFAQERAKAKERQERLVRSK
ncbi:hypothetical protein JR316_0002653 [Psilocybe cubensis]|uniref:Uncharacterized protein n=2 Tax=Psilocybe cubensis TaxID=181762 RepID=A0ACB8HCT6_PSICU|nr:hypothetical protein JR316_0002653 [Psilocybe cubensis]KAH9485738.1 hypothetical protein JR316_0002653 [Psilocybe cubensis]